MMGKRNLWIRAAIIITSVIFVYNQALAVITASATATPSTISAGQTSQLSCTGSGGSGTYYYSWSSTAPGFVSTIQNPVVAPNVTTTYTCQVYSGGQVGYASVTVYVNGAASLTATATATPPSINVGQNSQLNCNPTGGSGTYTYAWVSNPAGFTSALKNPVVSPIVNTGYTCTVTSGTQTTTATTTVTVIPLLDAVLTATPQTINTGQSSQLNCSPTGGTGTYTYSWTSNPAGFTSTLNNPVVAPVVSTSYICVVTSGTLTTTKNILVSVSAPVAVTATATPNAIISGQTSQLNASPTGGTGVYTYSWTSNPAGFTSSLNNPVVSPTVNTTYTCVVTSGTLNCSGSVQVVVTPLLTAVATATPSAITQGQTSQLNCNPTGGNGTYSYAWTSNPAGFSSTLKSPVVSPVVNTTYTCSVISGTQNITATIAVTVGTIPALSITLTATPNDINPGQTSTLNCNPTGGTGTYTYAWTSNPAGFTSSLKSPVVSPTATTAYTCSVASGSQNTSAVITLRVNIVPVLTVTTSATPSSITSGQSSQLNCTATGGTSTNSYAWTSVPAGFVSTLQNPLVSPTVNTTYTCTVTNGTLTASSMVSVTVIPVTLTITANANPGNISRGQSSQLTCNATGGTGNYTYSWTSNPAGFTSTLRNPKVYPRKTTIYQVTVNDGVTTKVTTTKVYVWGWFSLDAIIDNPSSAPICKGESAKVTVNATGGMETYTYAWSSVPAGFTSTEKSPEITPDQTIQLICEVSDGDSSIIVSTNIMVNLSPTANAGADITAKTTDPKVTLNGSATNYSGVLWTSDGDGIFSDPNSLKGEYAPGPADLVKGTATLTLTANAAAPCTESVSSHMVLSFSATTSIPDPTADNYSVSVYPNPTAGIVHIKFLGNENTDATAIMIDVQGKVLNQSVLRITEGAEVSFDLSAYPSGFYFIKIQTGSYTKTHKVIRF